LLREKAAKLRNVPALLQAFLRLVALKRLGVLLFVLAATLCASSTASALEPTQTKTRVWGFDFAEHNSNGLLSAATHGKHQGNRVALSELASGSLLAAEGAGALESQLPEYLYHYTSEGTAQVIEESQFLGREGSTLYLTPNGGLSPTQAGIELALPQTNTAGALFRVPTSALNAGQISRIGSVTGNVLGRGGGGIELLYEGRVPLDLVERLR
jgi:hypothetical protein